jgi:hypothetical protein
MKSFLVKFMIFAIFFSIIAIDSNAKKRKKPEVPVPVQNLMKFLGYWEANATLTMNGKTYPVLYSVNCKVTAGGNGFYADDWFIRSELGTLEGANLVGFDSCDSKIKWFTVDNHGTTREHVGEWETPDHLYIEYYGNHDGKKYNERIDFNFKGKKELDFKLVSMLDGVESQLAEGVFRKK